MPQSRTSPRPRPLTVAVFSLVAVLTAAGLFSALATARPTTKSVVREAHNRTLDRTVLIANNGLTLYSLSAERHGNFICTGSCLKDWFPLVVARGVKPTGPVALGTIKRPNGKRQVTFKGLPLYTFVGDSKRGDATGEGIRDVGTWHAASP